MAVAYETSLTPQPVTFLAAGEAETIAFDAGTGTDRVLLVFVSWRERTNTISGVTYNGVAMTSLGTKITESDASPVLSGQLWALAGPASGSNNLVVTMGAGVNSSEAQISAWVGNGVDQTTPTDGYATNRGNAATANIVSSVTVTSEADDRVVVFHATRNLVGNITATPTNYTERQDTANGTGFSAEFGDADGAASVATSATWSNGANQVEWIALGVNLNASAPAAPTNDALIVIRNATE